MINATQTLWNSAFRIFLMMPILFVAQDIVAQTAEKGKLVYDTYCLACHQIDGSGVPALNPTLQGTSFVKGDKNKLINIVLNGLKNTEIDGEMYDNPMPPFAHLSDEDVASVLTYVRSNFTNKESAVKTEEVTAIRKGK